MRITNSADSERWVPCLLRTTEDYQTLHLKPELGEETNQENREDRREDDDIWATIMINIKKMLIASREGTVRARPSHF
jgi:hypothetical protein